MAGDTISQDQSAPPVRDSVRQQFNKLVDDVNYHLLNRGVSDAAVAIGTTASKARTAATFNYMSNGVWATKASTDDFWTLSGTDIPTAKASKFLLCINAAGTASVQQSSIEDAAADCVFAHLPAAGVVIVGILTIENASGADFVLGTTLLSAAGITDTYQDGISAGTLFASKVTLPYSA